MDFWWGSLSFEKVWLEFDFIVRFILYFDFWVCNVVNEDIILIFDRLGVFYLVFYIDWGNVGNVYIVGMGKDWGIIFEDYLWIVMVFYIGYIFFYWVSFFVFFDVLFFSI